MLTLHAHPWERRTVSFFFDLAPLVILFCWVVFQDHLFGVYGLALYDEHLFGFKDMHLILAPITKATRPCSTAKETQ